MILARKPQLGAAQENINHVLARLLVGSRLVCFEEVCRVSMLLRAWPALEVAVLKTEDQCIGNQHFFPCKMYHCFWFQEFSPESTSAFCDTFQSQLSLLMCVSNHTVPDGWTAEASKHWAKHLWTNPWLSDPDMSHGWIEIKVALFLFLHLLGLVCSKQIRIDCNCLRFEPAFFERAAGNIHWFMSSNVYVYMITTSWAFWEPRWSVWRMRIRLIASWGGGSIPVRI